MNDKYEVKLVDDSVGEVMISRQGLYYSVECTVKLSKPMKCRLIAQGDSQSLDLGLCVPKGECMVITTKIPVKRFPRAPVSFVLLEPSTQSQHFIPICAEKPFPELYRLSKARLEIRNEVIGAIIQN